MFYEEGLIDENLKCQICLKRFQDPVFLPCGENVCQKCINDYIEEHSDQSNSQFKCCVCDEEHLIPKNGFPKSKMANKLVQITSKQVYRSEQIEKFKADINDCLNQINRIKQELDNKEETIRDYFELKRQQIQTVAESKITEINNITKELLDQVDLFENQNLKSFRNDEQERKIRADLNIAKVFCNRWLDRLKLPQTNDNDVEQERDELSNLFKSVQEHSLIASDFIFNSKQIHFVDNQDPFESSVVGKFDIASHRLENVSFQEISGISSKLELHKKTLLDVNQFENREFFSTCIKYNSTDDDEDNFVFLFSILDTSGDEKKRFQSKFNYTEKQLSNMTTKSLSNGSHVLVSIFFPSLDGNDLFIVSNDKQEKYESEFFNKRELKTSIDSQHVYVLDTIESVIDVYDFTFQQIKSIKIGEQFNHLLDPSLPIMINDGLLYACNNNKVDTYQLSDFNLTNSFNVSVNDSPLSKNFAKDCFILRYRHHLEYVDLKNGRTFQRAVNNVDWSRNDWKMTAYDIDRLIFFNTRTDLIQISSLQ